MHTVLSQEIVIGLPEGFTARGANLDDVEPALALYNRWSQSVVGRDEITDSQAIHREWQSPNFDPAEDIRVVFGPDGRMAGYIEVWTTVKPPVHPWMWGRVDPDFEGMGVGSWLLHWAEERALRALPLVPDELRFAPRVGTFREAVQSRDLFESFGYRHIRSSYHMLIDMNAPVPEPEFPEGITLRIFDPDIVNDLAARSRAQYGRPWHISTSIMMRQSHGPTWPIMWPSRNAT